MRIVFISDTHLGLRLMEVDRTDEIISVLLQAVKHASKLSKKEETVLVIGGDIFQSNTPSEALISAFIRVMNAIKKAELKTYIISGNHDAVADPDRLSCLSFIRKMKVGYPTISLIEDIKFMQYGVFDTGPLCFTFLPHITKATLFNKIEDGSIDEMTTQEYINSKCERILSKVGKGSQHIVFSHLNIHGAHGGSEENMLKKSEAYLPSCFTNVQHGFVEPVIVQAHNHMHQKIGNINIVGSPICCGFGEVAEKYFLDLKVATDIGEEHEFNYIRTNCKTFKQLEINMIGEKSDFLSYKEIDDFVNSIEKGDVVKFDITIDPENNFHDWKEIVKKVSKKTGGEVKPIIPKIVLKRPVRSTKQKIGLDTKTAIKIFLKRNYRDDIDKARKIYKTAIKYLE